MKNKQCPKCQSESIIKYGFKNKKQRFKCCACKCIFQNTQKETQKREKVFLKEYLEFHQSYGQIGLRYGVSEKTVCRVLKQALSNKNFNDSLNEGIDYFRGDFIPKEGFFHVDATFFGKRGNQKSFGNLVFRHAETRKNVLWILIKTEKQEDYELGIQLLESRGIKIKGIICDGKKYILHGKYPAQMCLFHQKCIIRRYLTSKPRSDVGQELWVLTKYLLGKKR